MLERLRQNSALFESAILAFILPGVAGAINASGFFAVGVYTSHMTGNVAQIGDQLASGNFWLALRSLLLVTSFGAGAMVATFLVLYGKRVGGPPYWRVLLLECALLFVFATFNVGSAHGAYLNSLEMTSLLCFAMGLQNALVTKLSGARIRNTHVTGVTTDIAIETARTIDTWREGTRGMSFAASMWHLKYLWQDDELRHLRLHLAVFSSFLAGAALGPLGYIFVGHIAMLAPCAVLALLAAFDVWVGLTAHSLGQPPDPRATTSIGVNRSS